MRSSLVPLMRRRNLAGACVDSREATEENSLRGREAGAANDISGVANLRITCGNPGGA